MTIPKGVDIPTKSYSREIAETITSEFNQSYSLLMQGRTGGGKSFAALRIAYNVSLEVAKIMGGKPQDYFNIDNVAIITIKEVQRVLGCMKQYGIYIMDDIGVGLNARKWQSQINTSFNDIFTTFRTENSFLICTVPDSFLMDKVPRRLVHAMAESEMSVFKKGISIFKLFEILQKPRLEKTFFVYPRHAGKQYVRLAVRKPPQHLIEPYEKKRREIARLLKEEKLKNLGNTEEENNGKEKKISIAKQIETRLLNKELPADIAKSPDISYSYIMRIRGQLRKNGAL